MHSTMKRVNKSRNLNIGIDRPYESAIILKISANLNIDITDKYARIGASVRLQFVVGIMQMVI